MNSAPLNPLSLYLGPSWAVEQGDRGELRLRSGQQKGPILEVHARRCIDGPLRDTYPVGAYDVELYVAKDVASEYLIAPLAEIADAILGADPHCRRVVFAAPAGDQVTVAAAQEAGFRYVLDVDVRDRELSLLVVEPHWATNADIDLGRVAEL
jgi:hypothetical protein